MVGTGSGVFLYQLHDYSLLTPTGVDGPPASLLGLSALSCVLAWFIWQFDYSSKSQVISLATLITIIGVIETCVGIWALVRHQQIYALPEKVLQKAVLALSDSKSEDLWHRIHIKLNCCGINGASEDFRQQHKHVPWSCCYEPQEIENNKKNCERGCHHLVIHRTQSILLYTFLLALSSIILKACTISLAWCYAKAITEGMLHRRKMLRIASQASAIAMTKIANQPMSDEEHGINLSPSV
ncbi:PREDICTED: uncharacterized protein LOC105366507 isoform X2 [Ceratosolen solmsi marchali]|nr:PREDICTED: uncharacterized protein LOC105366507 isoform X2 [Ceratosolen solmsi marchali]XP_011503268.1 PREDICTED: uncharacterized protein LOC105366507 isoform X2 [Ceratosolen solmsi marchali]